MRTVFTDIRYALRTFRNAPGFTAAATVTLALGIGVNVAVFALLHAALIESLPVRDPERLVQPYTWTASGGDHFDFSYPLYVDLRDSARGFEGLAAYLTGTVGVTAVDRSERVVAEFVTSNYFPLLGVNIAGPGLTGADELRGGPRSAVISHGLWLRMFGGAAGTIGRPILVNGQAFTIVGVAPRDFEGVVRGQRADLWASVSQFFPLRNRPDLLTERTSSWLNLLGRLAPGVDPEQARSQLTAVARQIAGPSFPDEYSVRLRPAAAGDTGLVEGLATPLHALMATVGLILLIACANVANLLIARASTRQREVAMRQALGATRARIARQLFTEILVLSAAGGALGLLCAFWIVDLFELRTPGAAAALSVAVRPQPTVVLFAAVLSMFAALAAGVAPALGSSRSDLVDVLKQAGGATTASPGRRRLRAALAVVQVALSLVLIVGAGLFLRSLARLRSVEPSLATDRVVAATVNLNLRGYDEPRGSRFYEELLSRVSAQPGIEAATLASALPVTQGGTRINLNRGATRPAIDEPFEADMISASAGYFRTFGIPLVRGRDIAVSDRAGSRPVIIINETMKQRIWRDADPLGQTLFMADTTYEVIGVARDTKYRNLRETPRMTMYLPLAQSYASATNLVVRTAASTDDTVARVRREVQSLDPALPLYNIRTLAEHVERSLYVDAMRARLVSALALLAMTLAAVGIYGLISFNATERTREVGLRLALGARPSEVLRMVLATGARLALAGIGLGLLLSMSLTRLVATELYGTAWDPITFAGGALLLFVIVVLATLVPAVRVTRVDPMTALRYE